MAKGRIGVMTGGGDTTALNATLKGVALEVEKAGCETIGIQWGWAGMLSGGTAVKLPADAIDENRGGTIIRSSRTNLRKVENGMEQAVQRIADLKLDGFVAIGGDDTLTVGAALGEAAHATPVNCVTKTIDNDVGANSPADQPLNLERIKNYYCPGFITAAQWLGVQTAALRTTAYSHGRIMALETMGRTAGWLALSTAYGRPDAIVLPEVKTDISKLAEIAAEAYERQKHAVIVIAEGAEFEGAEQRGDGEVDAFGHKKLEGSSAWAAEQIKESMGGVVVNHVIPAYLQRCGVPRPLDRDMAIQLGREAAKATLEGRRNAVACPMRYGDSLRAQMLPIDEALVRGVDGAIVPRVVDERLYDAERLRINDAGWEYFRPLLGEPDAPYESAALEPVS